MKNLHKYFPKLLRDSSLVNIPEGWGCVVIEALKRLDRHLREDPHLLSRHPDDMPYIAIITETQGELRISISGESPKMLGLVDEMREECKNTCALCGSKGELYERKTRCNTCRCKEELNGSCD